MELCLIASANSVHASVHASPLRPSSPRLSSPRPTLPRPFSDKSNCLFVKSCLIFSARLVRKPPPNSLHDKFKWVIVELCFTASASTMLQSPKPGLVPDKSSCLIVELCLIASASAVQPSSLRRLHDKFRCVIVELCLIASASTMVQSPKPMQDPDKSNCLIVKLCLIASASAVQSPSPKRLDDKFKCVIVELRLITSAIVVQSPKTPKGKFFSDKSIWFTWRSEPREHASDICIVEFFSFLHSPMHFKAIKNSALLFTLLAILATNAMTISSDCKASRPHVNASTCLNSRKYLFSGIKFSGKRLLFITSQQR